MKKRKTKKKKKLEKAKSKRQTTEAAAKKMKESGEMGIGERESRVDGGEGRGGGGVEWAAGKEEEAMQLRHQPDHQPALPSRRVNGNETYNSEESIITTMIAVTVVVMGTRRSVSRAQRVLQRRKVHQQHPQFLRGSSSSGGGSTAVNTTSTCTSTSAKLR